MSQSCDQGHSLSFDLDCCEVTKDGKLIANASRVANNLYILDNIKDEKFGLFPLHH